LEHPLAVCNNVSVDSCNNKVLFKVEYSSVSCNHVTKSFTWSVTIVYLTMFS